MDVDEFIQMFECDTAEIQEFPDKKFLIIGWNKNTKTDGSKGQWYKNGIPYDFDYVERHCVASGKTDDELRKSALHYKKLCGMTTEEFLEELAGSKV